MANLLRYWGNYWLSQFTAKKQKHHFQKGETYCMFIGHGRSGHTACGAVLNAHPEIVIGHELDALSYLERGISRDQLFALILKKDRWFTRQKYQWHGYNYEVPNQWQGRFRQLKVIGDRKAGLTTLRLQASPHLLPRLRQTVGVPLRTVHLLRNPFDILSTLVRQSGHPLNEQIIDSHFEITATNARLLAECPPAEIMTIRHEDIISCPKERLRSLVNFLGPEADDQYLTDCASILHETPSKSRQKINWPAPLIKKVHTEIAKYPFLQGYSFES